MPNESEGLRTTRTERARKEIEQVIGYADLKPSTREPLERALAALDEEGGDG